MKSRFQNLKKIITLWPIGFLLIVIFLFLFYFSKLGGSDSYNVVLGISLGVLLGFLADISKRTFDEYQKENAMRKTALKLLEQDAKSIYRTFESYKQIIESANQPNAPQGVENFIPPNLEMKYWERLSSKDDFLSLATEDNFIKIFKRFWEFEKLNNLIESARENKDEERRKGEYGIALVISKQILEDKDHENFLQLFLNSEEFLVYKNNWRKKI